MASLVGALLLGFLLLGSKVHAVPLGFQLNLFEPTAPGEWSLLVDHPWYSSTRYFAGGITLNYGHNPMTYVTRDNNDKQIVFPGAVEHQFLGHVDLAGSFSDRVLIVFSLPITFYEAAGTTDPTAIKGVYAADSVAVGDPRLGLMVRLFGQPYKDAFSISVGGELWFPINSYTNTFAPQEAESGWRFRAKLMLGGLKHHVLWSFLFSYYYRPDGFLGSLEDRVNFFNFRSSQVQLGFAIAYANLEKRVSIGPEFLFTTTVANDLDTSSVTAFALDHSSIELLLGIHYNIASQVQLSVGGGIGFLRDLGTPDGRVLFRIAYAPIRKEKSDDRDHDGIKDKDDRCPDQPGTVKNQGCPDLMPAPSDRDGDGILDSVDQCPDVPQGPNPDPARKGCPRLDRDEDGVFDDEDLCPDVAQGLTPDRNRKGCPAEKKSEVVVSDRDKDGILDAEDDCPDKAGTKEYRGCPPPPSTKHVKVVNNKLVVSQKIQFATGKAAIQKASFKLLDEVVFILKAWPTVKVRIEGHTDSKGNPKKNMALSQARAESVKLYFTQHGLLGNRFKAEGFGDTQPIADNKKAKGRDQNRRTEFVVIQE